MPGRAATIGSALYFVRANAKGFFGTMKKVRRVAENNIAPVGRAMTAIGATVAVGLGLGVKAAADFESAFAGVRKTVNESEAGFKLLETAIIDMSKRLPTSAVDLARIMEIAGQLGIEGQQNLLKFTETMARLADSTNIVGEEGTLQLARFMNVMGTSTDDVDKLGATIVALGNNMAAQEAEILNIALGLAAVASQSGWTEEQTLSLAAAIAASGGEAQAAASAFQKVGLSMQIEFLSKDMTNFANATKLSKEEFQKLYSKDSFAALKAFLQGLKEIKDEGKSVAQALAAPVGTDIRIQREVGKLIANLDDLEKGTKIATKAFKENIALIKESNERYKTFISQVGILKNNIFALLKPIGDALLPHLRKLNSFLIGLTARFSNWAEENPDIVASIVLITTSISGLLLTFGPVLAALPSLIGGFTAVAAAVSALTLPILTVIGVLGVGFAGVVTAFAVHKEKIIAAFKKMEVRISNFFFKNKENLQIFAESMASFFFPIWEKAKEVVGVFVQFILDVLVDQMFPLVLEAFSAFIALWNKHWPLAQAVLIAFLEVAEFVLKGVVKFFKNLTTTVTTFWGWFIPFVELGFDVILTVLGGFVSLFENLWDAFWNDIVGGAVSSIDGIKTAFSNFVDWLINGVRDVREIIGSIPDFFGGFFGKSFSLNNNFSQVSPAANNQNRAGGGDFIFNFNVSDSFVDSDALAEKVARTVSPHLSKLKLRGAI